MAAPLTYLNIKIDFKPIFSVKLFAVILDHALSRQGLYAQMEDCEVLFNSSGVELKTPQNSVTTKMSTLFQYSAAAQPINPSFYARVLNLRT